MMNEDFHPDSTIYQLSDLLDRLVSLGAMFGFGRQKIIEHLQRQEAADAELRRLLNAPESLNIGHCRPSPAACEGNGALSP